jgi:hypothetical protein
MRRLGSAATQNSTASINPVGNAGSVQGVVQKKHKCVQRRACIMGFVISQFDIMFFFSTDIPHPPRL